MICLYVGAEKLGDAQYVLREIALNALRNINGDHISDKSNQDNIIEEEHVDRGGKACRAAIEFSGNGLTCHVY